MSNYNLIISLLKKILETDSVDEFSEIGNPTEWNSLKHIEILLELEKQFNTKLDNSKISQLSNVKKLNDYFCQSTK